MVPAGEALQHQAGRQKVQTGAAVFLGDGGTEKAVIADNAERFVRPPFLTVHPFGKRIELLACETISLIEDSLLLPKKAMRAPRSPTSRASRRYPMVLPIAISATSGTFSLPCCRGSTNGFWSTSRRRYSATIALAIVWKR